MQLNIKMKSHFVINCVKNDKQVIEKMYVSMYYIHKLLIILLQYIFLMEDKTLFLTSQKKEDRIIFLSQCNEIDYLKSAKQI